MNNEFDVSSFDQEVVSRANAGSANDGRTALVSAVIALNRVSHTSPYLLYLLHCLEKVVNGEEPSQALNIDHQKSPGVKARARSEELMAVDLYLRIHLGFPPEKSIAKVLDLFNLSDRRKIQRLRKKYDGTYSDFNARLMEQQSLDDLIAEMTSLTRAAVASIAWEMILVDLYLRFHLQFLPEKSEETVLMLFGLLDVQQMQRLRKEYEDRYPVATTKALGDSVVNKILNEMTKDVRLKVLKIKPHI